MAAAAVAISTLQWRLAPTMDVESEERKVIQDGASGISCRPGPGIGVGVKA